jgi:hypothetical protein
MRKELSQTNRSLGWAVVVAAANVLMFHMTLDAALAGDERSASLWAGISAVLLAGVLVTLLGRKATPAPAPVPQRRRARRASQITAEQFR